ncbi:MAG: hypothetical protein FJ125_00990 [Deltaproteobacteria bacterium]|nr:hypothetical protein [Deltaproteobacteria bacterium]
MTEHTLILRLGEADDPTVAEVAQRCRAAAAAFGGELVAWETGDALQRVAALREKLAEIREQLRAHGLLAEQGEMTAGREEEGAGRSSRVAGEVARLGGRMAEWPGELPPAPAAAYPFPLSAGLLPARPLHQLHEELGVLTGVVAALAALLAREGRQLPEAVELGLARLGQGAGATGGTGREGGRE